MEQKVYVMSDLHGCFDKYQEMLAKINFSENDKLIILGDILDRGPEPIKILKDIMERDNVELLLGNHELFALRVLPHVSSPIDEMTEEFYDAEIRRKYFVWLFNGGGTSFEEYYLLKTQEQKNILAFLQGLPTYKKIQVEGKEFFLVHAGIENYTTDEALEQLTVEDFVWHSPSDLETPFLFSDDPDRILVFGHTPTFRIDAAEKGKIIMKNNYIAIDCGAVFSKTHGGRLGCLRLNDMKEYYV